MNVRVPILALALAVPLFGGKAALADGDRKPPREQLSFGTLRTADADEAKAQAQAWLQVAGKADAGTMAAFTSLWAQNDRSVLDRVSETLMLGDVEAKKLLTEARDPQSPAPQQVPAAIKDAKKPAFYRANLGLAYGKALSNRRVYEESLEALKAVKVEQVVDPAAYLFHRSVAEHGLMLKDEANRTILRLLDDAQDVPDRYKMVSVLMAFDMQSWKDSDMMSKLGGIARRMDNIERRLDLSRGGPKTQKLQRDAVARLDEIIKELENQQKGNDNGGC